MTTKHRSDTTLVGYARVSTRRQSTDMQTSALERAGCVRIFTEVASGKRGSRRLVLDECLAYLRPGDTFVVWKLDRLGRSVRFVHEFVDALAERGIGFRSVTEGFDTTTPAGKFMLTMLAACAELERDIIRERVREGLDEAAEQGRKGGRPRSLNQAQTALVRRERSAGIPASEIARNLGVSTGTVYRVLRADETVEVPVLGGTTR